jgi:ComF family protein
MIEHIISLIAPHKCVGCAREGSLLCDPCGQTLGTNAERCKKCKYLLAKEGCVCFTYVTRAFAATRYTPLPQQLVWSMKFNRARTAASVIAGLCAPMVSSQSAVITYVPTANSRVRMRGYDQSRLIARKVAQYQRIPMFPLLARTSEARQVGADAEQRRTQLANAFRPTALPLIQGKHITLVDDVLTTGSTIEAAAHVLLEAGAARVDAVVFSVA